MAGGVLSKEQWLRSYRTMRKLTKQEFRRYRTENIMPKKYYGTKHQRLFGQWCVSIEWHKIRIVGNLYSNYGIIYGHMIDKWMGGHNVQIIGMDNVHGITKQVLRYIYKYSRKHHRAIRCEN